MNRLFLLQPRLLLLSAVILSTIHFKATAQDKGRISAGSIIVLSAKGLVQAIDQQENLVNGVLTPGAVLAEGYSIKTGFGGEASLLFSNGTVATLEPRSKLKVSAFLQASFELGGKKMEDLSNEPSSSQLELDLSAGSLVVETKKLDRSSRFTIKTPLGTAEIQGTAFQLGITPGGEIKLDVSLSSVSFTPISGISIVVSQGTGMNVAINGQVQRRPIDPVISINIKTKNSNASKVASLVPLNTVKQANQKASAISIINDSAVASSMEKSRTKDKSVVNDSDEEDSKENEATEQFLNQEGTDLRSLSGAETSEGYYLNVILALANTQGPVGVGATDFRISEQDGQLHIDLLSRASDPELGIDETQVDPKVLASLSTEDISFDEILDYLVLNLEHSDFDNEIIAVALDVFLDVHDVYEGNDNINDALQGALQLAHVFLTPVQISDGREFNYSQISNLSRSDIAQGTLLNAMDLKSSYENNPYLYEVGMILAQYGAIGKGGQDNQQSPSSATQIATDILTFIGGRDGINIPDSISLGDESNQILLNSGLLGSAHNDLIDKPSENFGQEGEFDSKLKKTKADELFKIYLENIYGVVGSEVSLGNEGVDSTIDVSKVLTKATRFEADDLDDGNNDKKIMAFAAAQDLHVKGDLYIKNSNTAEDHALVLGAADQIEIYDRKEAGVQEIFYEGSNLGIGSYSTLNLMDVDIDTGGNLALGSLSDIGINSSNFSVGRYSDRDNVYIFAEKTLAIDNLTFQARPADHNNQRFMAGTARQIYMEATTIDLKEVHFPAESEVMLRSRDGLPVFYGGIYGNLNNSRVPGAVNFYSNSNTYGGNPITTEVFPDLPNANNGKGFDSVGDFKTSSGDPAIKIRKFPD